MIRRPPRSPLFPNTPLFRSTLGTAGGARGVDDVRQVVRRKPAPPRVRRGERSPRRRRGVQLEHRDVRALDTIAQIDRKSTRLNSSHANISYAVFCLKKKKNT